MGEAIAITSGKGGVGKSSVCINMGMVLAQKGYRVCLIDVDLGLKNLDVMLGLENRVIYDLKDVMEGRCTLANAMIRDKRQDNLYLLPACKTIHIQYFHGEDLKIVVEELKNQFDYILLDTPAGIESGFIHSIACVSRAIVVTTLDVTALQVRPYHRYSDEGGNGAYFLYRQPHERTSYGSGYQRFAGGGEAVAVHRFSRLRIR